MINCNCPSDFIDVSIGEAYSVKEKFINVFGFDKSYFTLTTTKSFCEYPSSNGYEPLVKLLEEKHNAPIIITNGAKQALAASFYLMKKLGKSRLGMRKPYWALIPPLAELYGLQSSFDHNYDCYLSILPNNPDGYALTYKEAKHKAEFHKESGIPFIHDAAYYSHTYLPDTYNLGALGDLQIYSISKLFGLSGLRLGYIVVHNKDYYKTLKEYIETTTVGVSTASQIILHNILSVMNSNPDLTQRFFIESRDELYKAKFLSRLIRKDVLEVPEDVEHINGLFGWFKLGPKCNLKKAKIYTTDGSLYGDVNRVRINLGLDIDTLTEVIKRINTP